MKKYGFSSKSRLITKNDFREVFVDKNIMNDTFLRCYYKRNSLSYPRIGIVVSKKFGKAHMRNRFKRIVRESFRLYPDLKYGIDIIILPNPKNKTLKYDCIRDSIWKLLNKCYKKLGYE